MGRFLCIGCGYTRGDSSCGSRRCPKCNGRLIIEHDNKIKGFCGKCNKVILIEEVKTSHGIIQRYQCGLTNKIYNKPNTICEAL